MTFVILSESKGLGLEILRPDSIGTRNDTLTEVFIYADR
jgi:hypothetical protein